MHPDETATSPSPASDAATATPPTPAPEASGAATPTSVVDTRSAPAPDAAPAADEGAAATPRAEPGLSPAECGVRLAALFPALFVAPGAPGPFRPIKLRVHADILARAPGVFSKRVLGIFFSRYTTSNGYLKALAAPGAQRFDLDGQPAGEIAEVHRAAAAEELARRHAIAAERRATQPPRRAAPPQREPGSHAGPPADDAAAQTQARPQRPPRPQRPQHGERPWREQREPQRDMRAPARGGPPQRAPAHHERGPRRDLAPARTAAPPPTPSLPADPAQRERALLLRAFESSPLSKANFCTLKRISEEELDRMLTQAQNERGK